MEREIADRIRQQDYHWADEIQGWSLGRCLRFHIVVLGPADFIMISKCSQGPFLNRLAASAAMSTNLSATQFCQICIVIARDTAQAECP